MTRSFFFHYNKPASLAAGKPVLTVHYKGQCLLVSGIVCNVPVSTRIRKSQPRCVMAGKASSISILDGCATIN